MDAQTGRLSGPAGTLAVAGAIGAGLATGLARFPDPASIAFATLAALVLLPRASHRCIALGVLGGLALAAPVRTAANASCAARLANAPRRLVVESLDPGVITGRVVPLGISCGGSVQARWPVGRRIPAGVRAAVEARWVSRPGALGRPDGTLYVLRVVALAGRPGPIARSRNEVSDRITALFGSQAPVVSALLTGARGELPDDLWRQFTNAGLVHLLVISGSHVGLLAGWVTLVFVAIGLPRRWGLRAGALVALGYTAWLGWPIPAVRAAALLLVLLLGRELQRRWRPDGTLGASALVVLALDPWAMTRVGAWLSFTAFAGVLWALRWTRRHWPASRAWRDALAASIGATLATAPLSAWVFGRVALIGVGLNLIAVPLTALIVPAAMLAVGVAPLAPAMARAFAAATVELVRALVALGMWGGTAPGAGTAAGSNTGPLAALPWLALLGWVAWSVRRNATPTRVARRLGWSLAAYLLVAFLRPSRVSATPSDALRFDFLDVGQGDATVIRTPGGHLVVIDAGPAGPSDDAGRRVLVPFLARLGTRRIDLFVLSHAHRDHVGGATSLLRRFPVGMILDPGEPFDEPAYRAFLGEVAADGIRWHEGRVGQRFEIDGVAFTVVHAATHWSGAGRDLNEDSLVLLVQWRDFTALLTGDAGIAAEADFLPRIGPVDVLKVGHHGSRTATGIGLLRAVHPRAAVISVGRNTYGHPAPETLTELERADVRVWRTDQEGPVTVTTNGRNFLMRGAHTSARLTAVDP